MKKTIKILGLVLVAITAATAITSCAKKEATTVVTGDTFVIEGTLPAQRYDSVCLYLVPMQGPHPRPVDSVFITSDGKFRFEGNVEQMAVLRLSMRQRYGVQDLLVCTEPGVTRVELDTISRLVEGTPQNQLLQQWKDRMMQHTIDNARLTHLRRQYAPQEIIDAYSDSIRTLMGNDLYTMLTTAGRQTATIFMNKMRNGKLDSLRIAELDELLKDTVDWSKPQPGFRK